MSVYSQFCKGDIKTTRQMYLSGIELQSKLEKIAAYDKCNQQKAQSHMTDYCQTLFNPKESFALWTTKQFKDTCVLINKDKLLKKNKDACAALNEHMFA